MSDDHRKNKRYEMHAVASVRVFQQGSLKPLSVITDDISYKGLCIYSYSPLEVYTRVAVGFDKIEGSDVKERIHGKIVWSEKKGNYYYMGINFDEDLHPDKYPRLYEHFFQIIKKG